MTPELTAIFDQAVLDVETIAQAQTNDDSQVIPVNMFEGFEDRYLADDIHYNDEVQSLSPNDITKCCKAF